ncbi:MAG: hypothetical protein PUJ55_11630 [Clostridiales bacterium]|nr:hypothetical protein [Clostridiales bacterium]MDY4112192.1 hypothetical protein [Roseburia sp.]
MMDVESKDQFMIEQTGEQLLSILSENGERLLLGNRGKPMMPYQWEKKFQHSVEKYNKIYRVQLPKITPHVCR